MRTSSQESGRGVDVLQEVPDLPNQLSIGQVGSGARRVGAPARARARARAERRPTAHVEASDQRHVTKTDSEWIVSGWREHGWQ